MNAWPFRDPPNVAVIASRKIVDGSDWIALVCHDEGDGSWQFHTSEPGPPRESDAAVVGLGEIVRLAESVAALADLPLGWHCGGKPKAHSGSDPLRLGRTDARSQQAGPPAT
jgi:hypothetical protein